MKKDILRYEEDKIANVEITFPNEGTVTEIHISILPTETSIYANSRITFNYKAPEDYPFSQP
jgi:ubiquitin-protein ligase